MKIKDKLILIADKLDKDGLFKYAENIDEVIADLSNNTSDEPAHKESDKKESYMAKPQLLQISKASWELFNMIGDGEEIDDWAETYISQCEHMISQVLKSLSYNKVCKTCNKSKCTC